MITAGFVLLIQSMIPVATPTPPPGEDTIWRGMMVKQNGRVLAIVVEEYHCKVHENKKNGGLAYTKWMELKVSTSCDAPLVITWVVLNASRGSKAMVESALHAFEAQVQSQPPAPMLPGNGQVSSANGSDLKGLAQSVLTKVITAALQRVDALFTNQDGPVAFNVIRIEKPLQLAVNEHVNLGAACAGLTGRSNYVVDGVLIRTS